VSEQTGITVAGHGEAVSTRDVMMLEIGVSLRRDTVSDASGAVGGLAGDLLTSLEGAGVPAEDIATSAYLVSPEYDHREGSEQLLGYRVTSRFSITIRDLDRAGEIIDGCAAAAGDATTISGVRFSSENTEEARNRAREAAWLDALARAEQLADLAGRSLGPVESIIESPGRAPEPRPLARLAVAESTPIEPGIAVVSVDLEARFSIE
jgi:uncharacterized protein YggE